jgi:hypothetical protein
LTVDSTKNDEQEEGWGKKKGCLFVYFQISSKAKINISDNFHVKILYNTHKKQ